ncbi:MAG TPA: ROK family transcriptional regulator [Jiangellaceae bacterium]
MSRRPGTPSLLRAINDRSALELLLSDGPLTRARLGELTGLSKVTASQLVSRLQERGLIEVIGTRSAGRGPSAELYAVRPGCSHGVGIDMSPHEVVAAVADITGAVRGRVSRPVGDGDDPVRLLSDTVHAVTAQAEIGVTDVADVVVGTPGVVDPVTGDVGFVFDLPRWHRGLRDALRTDLGCDVTIENDVNLAAMAERKYGAARDVDDLALLWVGRGVGLAVVLGGRLHRGATGAAGEIGYLPVPGVPLPVSGNHHPDKRAFQRLVGAEAVSALAAEHGVAADGAAEAVRAALAAGSPAEAFLRELADRLAIGVAAVCAVVDPTLVVLAGEVGAAGDGPLCDLVTQSMGRIVQFKSRLVPTGVPDAPVLRGALLTAVDQAREAMLASTAHD